MVYREGRHISIALERGSDYTVENVLFVTECVQVHYEEASRGYIQYSCFVAQEVILEEQSVIEHHSNLSDEDRTKMVR